MTKHEHDSLVRRQFGATAGNYRRSTSHARGRSLARLLELSAPQPCWQVLDVATGTGHTAAALASHVDVVIAGDMTPEMLQQAAIVHEEQALRNIYLVQEDARALAYRNNTFDMVVCRVAAHHFPDPDRFVAEGARVLKPGGCFALVDNIVPDDERTSAWINDFERRRDPSHARCLSVPEWRNLFTGNGLEWVHEEVHPKRFDFHDWMRRMNVPAETMQRMEHELLTAPDAIRRYWQPERDGSRVALTLQEAILIGRP
ncbi:MAG: class I SAM-dependent methyltransferase [Gammaproteobacteria bacterium]|nr:class I SAM-dependent methyltransferase [Gammaproteobacteria bacterium]